MKQTPRWLPLILGLLAFAIISAAYAVRKEKHYTESCKKNGGVPVYSRSTTNCWSNEVSGWINVD